jgi:heme-degrading monooxygenase HmoA
MYALLTIFTIGPGNREIAEKMGDEFSSALAGLKGFKSMTMIGDDSTGEYGGLTLWESKEDAEAALASTGPKMQEALSGIAKGEPKRGVYEVWKVTG